LINNYLDTVNIHLEPSPWHLSVAMATDEPTLRLRWVNRSKIRHIRCHILV